MASPTHTGSLTTTLESQGRIPLPKIAWPIGRERFAALARRWRAAGFWLSLWNRDGQAVLWDEEGPRLWSTLWSRRGAFARSLSEYVRASAEKSSLATHLGEAVAVEPGPWHPDIGFLAIPIRRRTRMVGMVLAGYTCSDLRGEAFVRMSGACGLDHQYLVDLGADVPRIAPESIPTMLGLLSLTVEQARDLDVGSEEVGVLTQNLENTYEELSLIYRISAQMGLPQKPQELLLKVGNQVTEVSRAATIAFVLSETAVSAAHALPGDANPQSVRDRVVSVGADVAGPIDLVRLAEQLLSDPSKAPSHLLVNNAAQRPEFGFAHPWLEHVVALPLWHKQRLLGVMMAINCRDGGDFTSVDVQLVRAVADRVAAFLENQRLYDDLTDLLMGLLHAVVNSVDAKDPYTYGHSERVAFLSRALARAANLSPTECERIYLAGLLHDVGKIGVPDAILCKPGKLTVEEFDTLKKHPEIGVKILSPVRQMRDLLPGVLYHHERVDGRGYPEGLSGNSIPMLGRIICLADCFDAMTTNRTYRAALPLATAISEVRRCAGTQFDPSLAELFLGLDLEQLFQEARACEGCDATMSHLGALHAVLGDRVTH